MYPDAAFQARVDAAIGVVEAAKGGAVCPLRRIPLDLIAEVVAQDLGVTSALAGTLVPDQILRAAVLAVLGRFIRDPQAKPPNTTSLTLEERAAMAP